jgi:hypothetical protein
MSIVNAKAALWVRYLGGTTMHLHEIFVIPTDGVPTRILKLMKRGDIAEVWYTANYKSGDDFDKRIAHKHYPE